MGFSDDSVTFLIGVCCFDQGNIAILSDEFVILDQKNVSVEVFSVEFTGIQQNLLGFFFKRIEPMVQAYHIRITILLTMLKAFLFLKHKHQYGLYYSAQ